MKKRLRVHPLNMERNTKGLFATLVLYLHLHNALDRHHHYLRMSREYFDHIFMLVAYKLTKNTNMCEAIKPELKLTATIHHLAGAVMELLLLIIVYDVYSFSNKSRHL